MRKWWLHQVHSAHLTVNASPCLPPPQVLYGALVGGPGNTTDYSGERSHQPAVSG